RSTTIANLRGEFGGVVGKEGGARRQCLKRAAVEVEYAGSAAVRQHFLNRENAAIEVDRAPLGGSLIAKNQAHAGRVVHDEAAAADVEHAGTDATALNTEVVAHIYRAAGQRQRAGGANRVANWHE